jgi:hypothetical protein
MSSLESDLLHKFLSWLVTFIILWPRSGDSMVRQKQSA